MTIVGWIFLILSLLFAAILLVPVELRVQRLESGWRIFGKMAWFTFPIYPATNKKKPFRPAVAGKKRKNKTDSRQKPARQKPNRNQILHLIKTVPSVLYRMLDKTRQRIRLRPLMLHWLVADENPADAAILYGKMQAAFAAVMPLAHKALHIEEQDIQLFLDFQQTEMDLRCDIGIRLRPWDGVAVGTGALPDLITLYRDYQALATLEQAGEAVASQTET